jgi:ribosomal protein RSM22 (predicted rRNA methylase)
MPADDWCHFAQRIGRSREHRAAKGGALGYEDEKYSYVAVARAPGAPIAARVLRHPLQRPGLRSATVTRTSGQMWRLARDLRWGDALPQGMASED